jgi:hypothetical protein
LVEEKAMKAGAAKTNTARAQSKKRKASGVTKVVSKRQKTSKVSKDAFAALAKEGAESVPVNADATRPH